MARFFDLSRAVAARVTMVAWAFAAATGLLTAVAPAQAQINPDYVANIAIPGQPEYPRGCDLTSGGLGGQPVTASNQAYYIECLVLGPGGRENDIRNNTSRLQQGDPPQLVMGLLYNSPAFAATYNLTGLSPSDNVTFLYRLLMFQNPPQALLTQYIAELEIGMPIQYVFDAIMDDSQFSANNAILEPSFVAFIPPPTTTNFAPPPSPFTLHHVAMTSPKTLRPSADLQVTAAFNTAKQTAEAAAVLFLTNAAGTVVQTIPAPAYFTAGMPLTVNFSMPLSSDIGSGTFALSIGVEFGPGWTPPIYALNTGFATFSKKAEFKQKPKYTVQYNVPYGPDLVEQANIAVPNKAVAHRAMIMLHGGDWTAGDAIVDGPIGEQFLNNNYVVISANYRLASLPDTTTYWSAQIQDVQLIARYARANAVSLGIDPNQICIFGSSAGGHLGNWSSSQTTTVAGDRSSLYQGYASTIDCMLDNSGPVDLTVTPPTSGYPSIMGGALPTTAMAWYVAASPLYLVTSATAPTYIFQGVSDSFLPAATPMEYQTALQNAGVANQYVVTTCGHAFSGCTKTQTDAYIANAITWIDTVLPPPAAAVK